MATQITTLIENHPGEHRALHNEHGISFLIHHNGTSILFDSGQSERFLLNAQELNEDLSELDHVVLSHGHYDHTNGLPFLVDNVTSDFTLHVHRDFFHKKYATEGLSTTYLGASWDLQWGKDRGIVINLIEGTGHELVPGVHIVADFDHPHLLEEHNPRFVVLRPGKTEMEIDDFRDEISVVIETKEGLIVLVGCSHPGIINILDTINARFKRPIYAVLGGTHLVEARGKRLDEAIEYLSRGSIGKLGLSHCTGDEAMERLQKNSNVFYRNVTGAGLIVGLYTHSCFDKRATRHPTITR